jgi:pimeloyl-ACP methyl ester carboxylesterase
MRVRAGDLSLNVEEQGVEEQGMGEPVLVFLHYWGGSRRTWSKVIDGLKDNYRCVAYDQRGWGGSDAPAEGYTLSDLAKDALSLIEAMGLRRYVLVGHSMGGKVAQLVASRNPEGWWDWCWWLRHRRLRFIFQSQCASSRCMPMTLARTCCRQSHFLRHGRPLRRSSSRLSRTA